MEIITAIIVATLTFAVTNIDDIFLLILFYSQTNKTFRRWHIAAGQYLGFTLLVLVSLLGFLGGRVIPHEWIGLLGLLPIFIGVHHWLQRNQDLETETVGEGVPGAGAFSAIAGVTAVTFANGGDNIGVYAPLFAGSNLTELLIFLVVFYVLLAGLCAAGYLLASHPLVGKILTRYGHLIVPFVLIALGFYILIDNQSYTLISKYF